MRVRKLIGLLRYEIEEAADAEEIPNEILEAFVDRIVVHESSFDWYLRVDEVMQSCHGDMAGKSMLNYQRSSADKYRSKPYYLESLKNLKKPVIYIIGEKDPLVPLKDIYKAAVETPNSKVAVFKGCKHWSVKERPQRFCRIVETVFSKI